MSNLFERLQAKKYTNNKLKNILYNLKTKYLRLQYTPDECIEMCTQFRNKIFRELEPFDKKKLIHHIITAARSNVEFEKHYNKKLEHEKRFQEDLKSLSYVEKAWNKDDAKYDAIQKAGGNYWHEQRKQMGHQLYKRGSRVVVTNFRTKQQWFATINQVGPCTITNHEGKKEKLTRNQYIIKFEVDSTWAVVGEKPTRKENFYISGLAGEGD